MSLWFSASAVLPALKAQYAISGAQAAALSSGVALGFVVGTLLSAVLGLADRIESRRFFTASAIIGATVIIGVIIGVRIIGVRVLFGQDNWGQSPFWSA